jgi:N-acetylmuramoyl-L-alanine amidase
VKTNRFQRVFGFEGFLCKGFRMKNAMPCVGLVVLAGCLTFIVAPDEGPTIDARVEAVLSPLPTVVLDPGHGGKDEGASGNGLVEKILCLDVALRVEKILKPYNFPVVLTRRDDTFIPLEERAAIANRIQNGIFVSIHFNHARDHVSTGVETFYAPAKVPPDDPWTWVGFFNKPETPPLDNGETLAGFIQASLVMRTDAVNRGIKSRELYVVRHTRCPAVLVEGGFINNPLEAKLISNGEYRERLASAVAEGIMSYQKTRPQPPGPPTKLAKAGN